MGKSPAKWIKSVLFGKKTTRSYSSKKGTSDKGKTGGKEPAFTQNSPVISDPVLVTGHGNGSIPPVPKEESSNPLPVTNQETDTQLVAKSDDSDNPEKLRETEAAIKAQAAFRGYLARRAFRALKGIIRLQALIRGHLARRQALATLRATLAIVKFQALVRGASVRRSSTGLCLTTKKFVNTKKSADSWKENLSANAFTRRLLCSPIKVEPLHFQYDERDPNSVFIWSERWTCTKFWKPIAQPKKTQTLTESKPSVRKSSYAMETESGKLKRNNRTVVNNSEPDKSRIRPNSNPNPRKVPVSNADSPQETTPLSELEKVKRNLRKVSSSVPESSDNNTEGAIENPISLTEAKPKKETLTLAPASEAKLKKENLTLAPAPEPKPKKETLTLAPPPEVKPTVDANPTEEKPEKEPALKTMPELPEEKTETHTELLGLKEENQPQTNPSPSPSPNPNPNPSKRRSSFSASKTESTTNTTTESSVLVQSTPLARPSYMAMTESAKTKQKGQASSSPRLTDPGSGDKTGLTRRHSLPSGNSGSNNNGKLNLSSPRTQRPVHPVSGGKGKIDRSMHSSRDGVDRPIQVEWRR